ncbi:patatin-like phospholipase family protein [Alteribacter natronophilus]|uniref:patatin-like phospholipase family protein n=1 Tax=Alteribacter natronophilus TaxID=2583810 RepID=UPI002482B452|nr:patatin family protein [Alteribacter natronophilus]
MVQQDHVGLVLEGGGMRGMYTAGILEYFLENDWHFPYVIGVSAGACNAASYVSKQIGRNEKVTIGYCKHPDYISYKRWFTRGELFGMDLIFDRIPNKEVFFDFDAFFNSEQKFLVGTTDCETGEPVYYEKNEVGDSFLNILRASSSLPFVAPVTSYGDKMLMDGGISDPIPLSRSIMDGNRKHVVVLTQQDGYLKKPLSRGKWLLRRKYRNQPGLVKAVEGRSVVYNRAIEEVKQAEKAGNAFVFRPDELMGVSRIEKREERLTELFRHGYEHARNRAEELQAFLSS